MSDIIAIRGWRKGEGITWKCHGCGELIHYTFKNENKEDTMHNEFVKCESCNHEFQLIF
jgi:DNA-directed RNA polymerase subunit M/transcription elongation factor TFIIS